jgi:hypothetical protein
MDPKTWPSEYTITTSSNWVETVPRPKEGDCHPSALERRQEQWDAANERHQRIARQASEIRAEREEKLKASQDRQATEREAREQKQRGELEATLRRRFIGARGGDPDDLAGAPEWPC